MRKGVVKIRLIKFNVWDSFDKKILSWEKITSTAEFEKNISDYLLNNTRYICLLRTGMKDINGKDIYNGDILQDKFRKYMVVEYFKDGFWLGSSLGCPQWSLRDYCLSCNVVGNRYVNKDLLGKIGV